MKMAVYLRNPLIALAALAAMAVWSPAWSQEFSANCKTNAQALRGANLSKPGSDTTSTSFVDVEFTQLTFTSQGAVADCVVVVFAASAISENAALFVRAQLDGKNGKPTGIKFADHTRFETGAAIFVFGDVAKGDHTVSIQFRSSNGSVVELQNRGVMAMFKGQ